jgi:hypothetical protein
VNEDMKNLQAQAILIFVSGNVFFLGGTLPYQTSIAWLVKFALYSSNLNAVRRFTNLLYHTLVKNGKLRKQIVGSATWWPTGRGLVPQFFCRVAALDFKTIEWTWTKMTDSDSSFEALQIYRNTFSIISNGFLAVDFQSYRFRKNVQKRYMT